MPLRAQEINLNPNEQDGLAHYIQACELQKKNVETYKGAYQTCVDREKNDTGFGSVVIAAAISLVFGFVLGAATR